MRGVLSASQFLTLKKSGGDADAGGERCNVEKNAATLCDSVAARKLCGCVQEVV
jgi:hypothetical protein